LQGIDEHLAMNNELSSLLDLRNRESEFLKDLEPKKQRYSLFFLGLNCFSFGRDLPDKRIRG
jgi:hypothetical protein